MSYMTFEQLIDYPWTIHSVSMNRFDSMFLRRLSLKTNRSTYYR